jgi:hypothetical protein
MSFNTMLSGVSNALCTLPAHEDSLVKMAVAVEVSTVTDRLKRTDQIWREFAMSPYKYNDQRQHQHVVVLRAHIAC